MDYSTVAQNLQSGLIGQSRALYKYGIDITNATLATYAYNLGISKSVSEMTQMEKQQLRVLAILDQSKVSWGDLANTINSPSNMLRQFGNNMKEVGMVAGQLFIPILSKVMPIVNGVAIAIKRLLVGLASLMGVKIDFESFGQSGYKDTSDGLEDGTYGAVEEFNKLPPLVKQAVGMPDNLRNWAMSDYQAIETVIQSNFLKNYRTVVNRSKELNCMPPEIKSLIDKANENSYKAQIEQKFQRDINTLQIKENALIGQNTNAEEYIEAPKEVQDRIDRMRG